MATRSRLSVLSLCSGIGGLDLGIHRAFHSRTVCYVEREAFAAAVFVARMEEERLDPAPIWDDLKTFRGREWRGKVDLVAAGYPCQPFSVAGKRKGAEDERHLWPDIKRIIEECEPEFVVLENVPGHVRLGLREVLGDLSEMGFDAEWGCFRANEVGAPHRRERLFVLAYRHSGGLESLRGSGVLDGERETLGDHVDGRDEGLAYSHGTRLSLSRYERKRQLRKESGQGVHDRSKQLRGELAYCDGERSQGLQPAGTATRTVARGCGAKVFSWPPGPGGEWRGVTEGLYPALESGVRGVADGLPFRVDQLRALGNGVVPQQAEAALRELVRRIV